MSTLKDDKVRLKQYSTGDTLELTYSGKLVVNKKRSEVSNCEHCHHAAILTAVQKLDVTDYDGSVRFRMCTFWEGTVCVQECLGSWDCFLLSCLLLSTMHSRVLLTALEYIRRSLLSAFYSIFWHCFPRVTFSIERLGQVLNDGGPASE